MPTLAQLIKRSKQRPVRRCYLKRRLFDGTYESDWQRIDWYKNRDRVISFGSCSNGIDFNPGEIGSFEISDTTMVFDNSDGFFNIETDLQSIFYPDTDYLNRKFAKIKIEAGYLDETDAEVGVETTFEGLIDKVVLSEDQTATITLLSYVSILNRYPVSDLGLTGSKTISQVVTAIMNQAKITTYIPYVAPSPGENITITDTSLLEGSYWSVLQLLSYKSNSVILLVGDVWAFKSREPNVGISWEFLGIGTSQPNFFEILNYDDEGAEKVRLFWQAEGTNITSLSSNTVLKRKYFSDPQIINLDEYSTPDKQTVLDSLLAYWENPRPTVEIRAPFLVNEIQPLDRVTIEAIGTIYPLNYIRWDLGATWNDGSVWGGLQGSVNILPGFEWMVIKVSKEHDSWDCQILCEKVV
jgi:hypothetical protein